VRVHDVLDATAVRRWCVLAAHALGETRVEIDALNVFPVPDGDTGTNLHLTVCAAAEAVGDLPGDADTATIWRALARGALFGARGNSGVILSQVLRGMADVLAVGSAADGGLAESLRHAADLADDAVAHPVEGTMLSVLRAAAVACDGLRDLTEVVRSASLGAHSALGLTTGQLDVLARNGVVDAGGAGLCVILDALAAVITDEYPERYEVPRRTRPAQEPEEPAGGFGYEVMYLLADAADDAVTELRHVLDELGDSLVVVGGEGTWNVHVHVDDAGAAIEAGMRAGRPYRIRVTYLRAEGGPHARHTGRGLVAVTVGAGLTALFAGHGASALRREAGHVPRVAELVEAIVLAGDEVVVLPNEREIVAVAEGAADRAREEGIRVAVIPTRASVQGLAALAVHDSMRRFDDDVIAMTRAAGATRFGQLQIATEEAVTTAGICRPGDVLGLIDGDVHLIGPDLTEVAKQVLVRLLTGGGELVTLITGLAADTGLAETLEQWLHIKRPDVEAVVYDGGQDRYPLLIGVE
jgi:DAK2 domain fusion protein YloV